MEHPFFLEPEPLPLHMMPEETVEDLQNRGLRLLQRRTGFRFGTDSVLLAAYASSFYPYASEKSLAAVDLGAGCGAVSLLLAARLNQLRICGIEVDPLSCETMARNIAINRLTTRMAAMNLDIRLIAEGFWPFSHAQDGLFMVRSRSSFDLVVANPPYLRPEQSFGFAKPTGSQGEQSEHERIETELGLDQLLQAASRLLRPGGRLVLVHRAHRLVDVLAALRTFRLEPKTLRLVQPLPDRRPSVFLLSAVKMGRPGGFQVESPLIVSDLPGHIGEEAAAWYVHEPLMPRSALFRDLILSPEYSGNED